MSMEHILGGFTGIAFGFLLQRGRVLRFEKQVSALLFRDMTILKFMLSAILVGMVGILLLSHFDMVFVNHKSMNVGAVILGGALFGAGWAVMGYCPGTSLGALGEGRIHAVFAIAGMIVGAGIYAELYPWMKSTVLAVKDFGKIGLPEIIGISPWAVVGLLWLLAISLFVFFERNRL